MPEPTDVQPPSDVEGGLRAYWDVSADIRGHADRNGPAASPVEARHGAAVSGHALNLAVAAFAGYALATLIHRRPAPSVPATPPQPQVTTRTSHRGPSPGRDERSSIRFR